MRAIIAVTLILSSLTFATAVSAREFENLPEIKQSVLDFQQGNRATTQPGVIAPQQRRQAPRYAPIEASPANPISNDRIGRGVQSGK
jgi:hypothetical protein